MSGAIAGCKRCQSEMRIEWLSGIGGKDGDVEVRFPKLPALVCARGHRRFVAPGFPMKLLEQVSAGFKVQSGLAKGWFATRYLCGGCNAALAPEPSASRTIGVDIGIPEVDPFRAELTVPVYACPSCGREQVRSLDEASKRVPVAMAQAFQAAEIPPG